MNPAEPSDLDTIIADYLQAAERGQAPAPASWIARYPDHAAELLAFLADLGRFGTFLGLPRQPALEATTDLRSPAVGIDVESVPGGEGERFGEYELIRVLGQGGMGTVYEARLAGTSLRVALKVLKPAALEGTEATRRLREEVENTASLRHPNIVPIYHVGEHAGQPFYTMELIEGGSLDQHLDRYRGHFAKAARLLASTARAVHHAHQRRILHRDLKPGNILLDAAGEPHVADFGLATRLDDTGTATDSGAPAGSLPWMAPEAVRGEPTLSTAIDVWALGVILYELLTGVRPFGGADAGEVRQAILQREPPAPRAVNPSVPRDLDAVCCRCLHKDPEKRYESATALAFELERWLRDEPVRARRAGRTERVARWCRRNPGLAIGSTLLLVLLLAGLEAALSLTRNQDQKLRVAVCRNNEFVARHVASSMLGRLEQLSEPVLAAVGDDDLRRACGHAKIAEAQVVLERHFQGRSRLSFATVYLLDPDGKLVALVDPDHPRQGQQAPASRVLGVRFSSRDYFQGALRHRYERVPRDRIHLSRVYRSQNDGLDKLAISCSVLPAGPNKRSWVLAATITTDATLGVESLHDARHKAVLFAPRDADPVQPGEPPLPAGYVILLHSAFLAGEKSVPFPADRPGLVPLPSEEPELRPARGPPPFVSDDDYADPVAERGHPEFSGRWLTGSARVGNTELIVLVQQRYEEAVAPYQAFVRRFLLIAGGLIGLVLLSLVGLRLLQARRKRQTANPSG
jgi:eukaryotic-like serine/threonine-protein kinase